MAGIFDMLGFPLFGSYSYGRRANGQGTADGGKPTRLDRYIDSDGPLTPDPKPYRMDPTKEFRVTPKSRFGGTGTYRGEKE